MTITRTRAEAELVRRCGGAMTAADMATTTAANFESALSYALRQCGLTASATVTDGDLSAVGADTEDKFFDLCEYRQLDNILGNLTLVDLGLGPRRESFGQIRQGIERRVERIEKRLKDLYGIGNAALIVGVYRANFAEHDDGSSVAEVTEE